MTSKFTLGEVRIELQEVLLLLSEAALRGQCGTAEVRKVFVRRKAAMLALDS